jgi:hypothetical protein
MKTVKGLNGCLTVGKNIYISTRVALLYILHYTTLNGIYFRLEYCGVEPKAEASLAPSVYPSTSVFVGLGSIHLQDQAPHSL